MVKLFVLCCDKRETSMAIHRFILGYFGEKHSVAQRNYKDYASSLLEQEYKNPLSDISCSAILGISDFVNEIKDAAYIGFRGGDLNPPKEADNKRFFSQLLW